MHFRLFYKESWAREFESLHGNYYTLIYVHHWLWKNVKWHTFLNSWNTELFFNAEGPSQVFSLLKSENTRYDHL